MQELLCAVAATTCALLSSQAYGKPAGRTERCEAAEAVLKDIQPLLNRPSRTKVFSTGTIPAFWEPNTSQQEFIDILVLRNDEPNPDGGIEYGWHTEPPSRALAEAFFRSKQASAIAKCDQLRHSGLSHGALVEGYSPKAVTARFWRSYWRRSVKAIIVSLSLPELGPDGREALAHLSVTYGPLDGGTYQVLLRKNAEGWKVAGRRMTAIS